MGKERQRDGAEVGKGNINGTLMTTASHTESITQKTESDMWQEVDQVGGVITEEIGRGATNEDKIVTGLHDGCESEVTRQMHEDIRSIRETEIATTGEDD